MHISCYVKKLVIFYPKEERCLGYFSFHFLPFFSRLTFPPLKEEEEGSPSHYAIICIANSSPSSQTEKEKEDGGLKLPLLLLLLPADGI